MSLAAVKDLCNEAEAASARGDLAAALRAAEAALALCRTELGEGHWAHALCLCAAGWARHGVGDVSGAERAFAAAVAQAATLEELDFERAVAALEQAAAFRETCGQGKAALSLHREVAAMLARQLGTDHPRYFAKRAQLDSLP